MSLLCHLVLCLLDPVVYRILPVAAAYCIIIDVTLIPHIRQRTFSRRDCVVLRMGNRIVFGRILGDSCNHRTL